MSITIQNLRFSPYQQKDAYKAVFGDELAFDFVLPSPHMEGDTYALGLDYEHILMPQLRPLCAYADEWSISTVEQQSVLTMALLVSSARFRGWASRLKKPTPITLQLVRFRDGVCDTLLLDDILALPSIMDGNNTVFHGDPLQELLDGKLDKPEKAGQTGNVLKLGADGKPVWGTGGGGGAAAWGDIGGDIADQTDLQAALDAKQNAINEENPLSYEYLSGTPTIPPPQEQSDWDESDSDAPSYIRNKPGIGEAKWGSIDGDLSEQTDLADALDGKANIVGGKVPDSELPKGEPITVIPAATSLYTLADGCYQHTPSAAPTYTLPAVTDATRTHWIVLDVSFSSVQTIAFEDSGGTTIVPLDTLAITAGDVVEYLCQYDPLQSKWVIACGKLNS